MPKTVRIAFVKFSEYGKSYPVRCDREDINIGDLVEVTMRAESPDSYYLEAEVVGIQNEKWNCINRIDNLASEILYTPSEKNFIERVVTQGRPNVTDLKAWRETKTRHDKILPQSTKDEMKHLYDEISIEDGEPAYLSDGIWLTPNGSLEEK